MPNEVVKKGESTKLGPLELKCRRSGAVPLYVDVDTEQVKNMKAATMLYID